MKVAGLSGVSGENLGLVSCLDMQGCCGYSPYTLRGEKSRQEPGVITYTTHVDPDNPCEFLIYEKYHDIHGLEAHPQTEHFKHFVLEKAIPLLESRVRKTYRDFE